ncbi:uncharacterized protein LTR77_000822 [Saxophila tyrrhenica]|uniref:DUF1772-domain-containing protein n=1 Tax=Saxophila tyrrhenica TaxID=1690608 RepID=A0AAV9PR10_9PEZI|nr:hypothetical protein LTR77_000822 [Saxophila tyrrhenica]
MANPLRDSPYILGAKLGVVGTTLFIAGGMASTSTQFIPALISAAQKVPSRNQNEGSGRLTPQPDVSKQLGIDANTRAAVFSFDGYRAAAQQFVLMSKTAFTSQVPAELLTIAVSGYLAYHSYSSRLSNAGYKWAAVAALVATIFPLTGGMMVPIDHKIARLGGDEEKVEPFDDAPPDREMERMNTVEFLGRWNTLNKVRSVVMVAAGAVGLWGLVE